MSVSSGSLSMACSSPEGHHDAPNNKLPVPLAYRYRPLDKLCFRVLYLLPGVGDEKLCGALESSPFKNRPHYKALSYVWGEPIFNDNLYIGEAALRITSSLGTALRRFRDESSVVALWADQICINQKDLEEREQQVAMMGPIYGRAREVLVWLGEESADDVHHFWLLHIMSSRAGKNEDENVEDLASWLSTTYRASDSSVCGCCGREGSRLADSFDRGIDLLEAFWKRAWFKRLWVVQELHSSKRATFFCGMHSISGAELLTLLEGPYGVVLGRSGFQHIISALAGVRFLVYFQSVPLVRRLLPMILLTAELRQSDVRDKVYALASLCSMIDDDCKQGLYTDRAWSQSFIKPDYQMPADQLWLHIAKLYVETWQSWQDGTQTDMHPSVLLALRGTQAESAVPWSWVLDLGRLDENAFNKFMYFARHFMKFSSGGPRVATISPLMEGCNVLRFNGKIVSTVRALQPGSQFPKYESIFMNSEEAHMAFFGELLFPWYFRCRKFMEDHFAGDLPGTVVREVLHRGDQEDFQFSRPLSDEWEFYGPRRSLEQIALGHEEIGDLLQLNGPERYAEYDRCQILAFTSDKRFAWVPEYASEGDTIAILESCPFPFVLRPAGDGHYRILGDAYVQGIMVGEAWQTDEVHREIILVS